MLLTRRGAFVLALAGLIGASLAVIAMSVSVAVIAPDWANTILLGAVLTRLLGGDFASGTGPLGALLLTALLALV